MKRDTKIICTLGPASSDEKILVKMAQMGMDVVRLNFSHGTHKEHKEKIGLVRKINKKYGFNIKILQDLEGFRIRIGNFDKPKILNNGDVVYISKKAPLNSKGHIPFDFIGEMKEIKEGYDFFIDDGQIFLKVESVNSSRLKLRVIDGGILKERKGINIPKLKLMSNIMTEKDEVDLAFGIDNNVDFVAQSFVRNKGDIFKIKKIVSKALPECKVISKIENHEGVHNINSITEACDGVMVARGDLGVSLPIYEIPIMQKHIIRRCNKRKKLSIVATQMLESMTESSRPTRAEVSDVANAVIDGADCVMLSGETAVGKYPVETVTMMRQVIEYAEAFINPKF